LAAIFFAFRIAGLGTGSALTAGCSAMATGAGAGSGVTSGTDGFSATTATGAGSATETASGFDAQADKARAERSSVTGIATLSVLDMAFSHNTVGDLVPGWNHPTLGGNWIVTTER
jgi:hypothetical protein